MSGLVSECHHIEWEIWTYKKIVADIELVSFLLLQQMPEVNNLKGGKIIYFGSRF